MRFCPSCGSRFSNDARYCPVDGQPTNELPEEAPKTDPMIGLTVDGRYRVDRPLGEGGMGIVYQTTHVALQKRFALKVLRGEMARDQDVVQRFIQEARASSAIGHPNIVDISDFGRLPDGSFYFVMEYLDGESLSDRISRGGAMTVQQAVPIIEMIASGLAAAHERGIVHRDLKPDNIFLVRRGGNSDFVKILDFGIAKVGGAASKLTRTGMIFGTPHYMSPEQAAGQAVDKRTDIYALGIIVYEMLTGHVPFDADTFMGILSKHMFEAPRPPTEMVPGPELGTLEPLILKALVKKPEERYQSMEEVLRDLSIVRGGGRLHAAFSTNPHVSVALAGIDRGSTIPTPPLPLRSGKTRYVALGAILLVGIGAIVGAGVHFLREERLAASDAAASSVFPQVAMPTIPAATAPVAPPASAPPRVALVRIETDPAGATVFAGGAIVGTTPVDVPRPTEGSTALELRLTGYRTESVALTPASASSLAVPLERDAVVTRAQPAPRPVRVERAITPPRTNSTSGAVRTSVQPSTTESTSTRPPPRRVASDVIDPWQ